MISKSEPFNWKDGLKIALALMTFGIGWFADNQSTVIAYSAVLIVWLIGVLAKYSQRFPWLKGKSVLTILIFAVSFLLSYLFQPFGLTLPPAWTGDAGSYVPLFSEWISDILSIVGYAVAYALTIYNILLSQVLEKVPGLFSKKT